MMLYGFSLSERQRVRFFTVWLMGLTLATLAHLPSSDPRGWPADIITSENDIRCNLPDIVINSQNRNGAAIEAMLDGPMEATDDRLIEWLQNGGGGRMFPPSSKPYNITTDNTGSWRESKVYRFYVRMIDKYFGNKRNGFFVEAGALDGVLLSATLKLEMEYNWNGLLVEPRPDMFEQLLEKHRKAYAARFCLSEKTYPHKTSFWMSPDYVRDSVAFSALSSQLLEKVQTHEKEVGNVVGVHCMPLVTLLKAVGGNHVDLLVLDVEGVEWGVIQNFPFDLITVDMLAVERKDKGAEDKRDFIQMIQSKGFTLVEEIGEDYVFIRDAAELNVELHNTD